MNSLNSAKARLRETLTDKRASLETHYRARASSRIVERLLNVVDWQQIRSVHCYEPIISLNEVDVSQLFSMWQTAFPRLRVYTSRKISGSWQVIEERHPAPCPAPRFDVVIVPMLGFDSRLHRIGYGGGYYDRLLSAQGQACKIGVCYEICKTIHIPREDHDIPMDMIITESNEYHVSS